MIRTLQNLRSPHAYWIDTAKPNIFDEVYAFICISWSLSAGFGWFVPPRSLYFGHVGFRPCANLSSRLSAPPPALAGQGREFVVVEGVL